MTSFKCIGTILTIVLFCSCAPRYNLQEMQGHWYVIEEDVGYIEFSVSADTMFVCSPKYGKLYHGVIQIKGNKLIQFEENSGNRIRLKGQINYLTKDSMMLMYEAPELCYKISNSVEILTESKGCFTGAQNRQLKLSDN